MRETIVKCDECGRKLDQMRVAVTLKGYKPPWRGGILLPYQLEEFDFCSGYCLTLWLLPDQVRAAAHSGDIDLSALEPGGIYRFDPHRDVARPGGLADLADSEGKRK